MGRRNMDRYTRSSVRDVKGRTTLKAVLTLPNPKHRWRLATDASDVAMVAVLSQIDTEGQEHPVGYYSRKLNEAERKWDIWETELAATVWATMTCRHHLRAVHFEL